MLKRAARRARRELRSASNASDEELHELRIQAKRARYAGELAKGVVGGVAKRMSKRGAAVQKVLGEHQDAVVAEERLESLAAEASPAAAFVAGRLAERQRTRREAARAELPGVARRFTRAAGRV